MLAFINSVLQSLILLISYISNHNSFPKPLSKEEEAECLRLMAEGDEEAKNKLIEHNLRLVAHVAKKIFVVNRVRQRQRRLIVHRNDRAYQGNKQF